MKSINFKLHPEKDKDIIEFISDKPKTWVIKTALRDYMKKEEEVNQSVKKPVNPSELFGSMDD